MQVDLWQVGLSAAIGICMAAGLVVGAEEWVWLKRCGKLDATARREAKLSLSMLPPNILTSLFLASVWAALYAQAQQFALWRLPVNGATLLAAFLAVEFSYYWEHRCAHRVPALWALYHAVHHSSSGYTVATAYRVSFLSQTLAPAFYLPWLLLGFDPFLMLGLQLLSFHYQAWVHTEMIGPLTLLDGIINTPAVHRMHHSAADEHRDRNFGAIILLWDRLFGTYAAPAAHLRYGIPGTPPPRSLMGLYVEPWHSIRNNRPP
jgi:sterol desaturase/sphingolipid hydroxylase (fatty acid hydroxylase superfamily)